MLGTAATGRLKATARQPSSTVGLKGKKQPLKSQRAPLYDVDRLTNVRQPLELARRRLLKGLGSVSQG